MAYNMYTQYPYQQFQQPQPQQIQNTGFVSVRSMEEAYNWPLAPGNSITFKHESQPFVYTKTKGFSPLDQPIFETYRLVKVEDSPQKEQEVAKGPDYDKQIDDIWTEINSLKDRLAGRRKRDKSSDDNAAEAVS